MKQRVKNISYLAKADIDLGKIPMHGTFYYEAIAIPAGAEIIDVTVQVVETAQSATIIDVGYDKNTNYFANDWQVTQRATHRSNEVLHTAEPMKLNVYFDQKPTGGRLVLRVLYFCPSEILTEV